MKVEEFQAAISEADCEAEGHYSPGEHKPWVVLCGEPYEYVTPEEAIAQARKLQG